MIIQPIGERVLLKLIKQTEERTKTGLYLPKSKDEKKEGIVEAVGTKEDGSPLPLKKGEKVMYGGYSSEEFELNGEKYVIIKMEDIVAKLI